MLITIPCRHSGVQNHAPDISTASLACWRGGGAARKASGWLRREGLSSSACLPACVRLAARSHASKQASLPPLLQVQTAAHVTDVPALFVADPLSPRGDKDN